jgi:hypothetical protein
MVNGTYYLLAFSFDPSLKVYDVKSRQIIKAIDPPTISSSASFEN